MQHLKRFLHDESGATAIEYGLMAALIAVAIIGAVTQLGSKVSETFQHVADSMPTSAPGGGGGGTP